MKFRNIESLYNFIINYSDDDFKWDLSHLVKIINDDKDYESIILNELA